MTGTARIVLDNRARVLVAQGAARALPQAAEEALRLEFEHANPELAKAERLGLWTGSIARTIRTWREEQRGDDLWLSLPRGGLGRVRAALHACGLRWAIDDRRTLGDPELTGAIPAHQLPGGHQLFDYQRSARAAARERQNCILRQPTASGKTTVGLALAAELNLPTLVVVWSTELLKEWVDRCRAELGGLEAGVVRGKSSRVRPVTVAMQQTLAEHPEWIAEHGWRFGLLIADEVHSFAAPSLFECIDPFPAKYRLGISADETRPDGKEFLVYDLFGEVAYEIAREELERLGHVHGVQIRVVLTDFRAEWYRAKPRPAPKDFTQLLQEMVACDERTAVAVRLAVDEALAGHRVLVWSQRVEHCRRIEAAVAREGIRAGLLLGGPGYRLAFEETRNGLRDGTKSVGVGTIGPRTPSGTGMNVPALDRGVLSTPFASKRQPLNQARGRLCRIDRAAGAAKRDSALYYLLDAHVFGLSHLRNLVRWFGDDVVVLDGGRWAPARGWLQRHKGDYARSPRAEMEGVFE